MQFSKIAPVMDAVAATFNLSLVEAGLSVSILGIVGIVFAISAGAIVGAIGLKRGIFIALFGGAAIAALGAAAPNAALFLISRVAEGFAHLLIVVCAPALMIFPGPDAGSTVETMSASVASGAKATLTGSRPRRRSNVRVASNRARASAPRTNRSTVIGVALMRSTVRSPRTMWPSVRPYRPSEIKLTMRYATTDRAQVTSPAAG